MDVGALRDSMLAVSGNLDSRAGGPAEKRDDKFQRRTLHGEASRFRTERTLTLFGFPDPSIHAEKRVATNTSVQHLFFLNSTFIKRQAEGLAARIRAAAPDVAARVRFAYLLMYGRGPEPREIAAAERFLAVNGESALADYALAFGFAPLVAAVQAPNFRNRHHCSQLDMLDKSLDS